MITHAEIRKWGNSLGIIIPSEVVKKEDLEAGIKVRIDIERKKTLGDIFGSLPRPGISTQKIKEELRKGWF